MSGDVAALDWNRDCRRMARRLAIHAALAAAMVGAGLAILARGSNGDAAPGHGMAILAAVLAAAVLAAAGHAALDAWLFGLMARHADERDGGAAVDRLLARLRLHAPRDEVRSAAARIAGSERVLKRLWLGLAAFAAATAFAAAFALATRGCAG